MSDDLMALLRQKNFAFLKAACERIIQSQPRQSLPHHALALISAWSGRFEDAAAHLTESLRPPCPPEPFLHLAYVLGRGLSDFNGAQRVLETGISLNPSHPGLTEAKHLFSNPGPEDCVQAVAAERNLKIRNLARDHRLAGRLQDAVQILLQGLLQTPLEAGLLEEFGLCRQAEGMHEESSGFFRALSRVSPKSAEAWCHLGASLLACGDPDEAAVALQKATQLRSRWHLPFRHLAMAQLQKSEHAAALSSLQHCCLLAPEDTTSLSQYLFSLNYLPSSLQGNLTALYRSAGNRFGPIGSRPTLPSPLPERLKIGYVSADFSDHPVAYFFEPLLEHHDKKSFELFAYNNSPKIDVTTNRFKALFDHWRDIWTLADQSLHAQIHKDGIHVLVDLSGHTPGNRLRVFGSRPAPLQITMIGCMQTTGLPSMDLRVTDHFLDHDSREEHESEAPLFMDSGAVVFRPPDDAPAVVSPPCSRGTRFTFASLNDPAKITPETLSLWARILLEAPDSELLLVRRPGSRLKEALQDLGVAGQRIQERGYASLHAYLTMHGEVDLALDPFPYNGLTVTLMACWMGVPTVTLTGQTPPARTAAGVLSRIGLHEFVCATPDDYAEVAARMFANQEHLANLRQNLRSRTKAAWCDGRLYAGEFERQVRAHLHGLLAQQT